MKSLRNLPSWVPCLGLLVVVHLAGCGREAAAPSAVPMAEAPGTVRKAFDGAGGDLKKAAEEASQALADGAYDVSLGRISELSSRPELSPEQRQALAQSRIAVMRKLQEQADSGDTKAKEVMEMHRASK